MRRCALILLLLVVTLGAPLPSWADSFGVASLTWHFGDRTATRAFGLNQSSGGAINYYDSTKADPWTWNYLLASDWPKSDGAGNSVTGNAGAVSGSTIAQSVSWAAQAPSATVGTWAQAYFGNSWYLSNTEALDFSVDWSFSGHTDSALLPSIWKLLYAFQMAVVYNNGQPGDANKEFKCYTDYTGWNPTTGFPYYMAYNPEGYNDGTPIVLDANGNFAASGTRTVSGCNASDIWTSNGRWVIDYNFAGSGTDYHPEQTPPTEVPEPATLLLVGAGLAWMVRRRSAK